MKVAYLVTSYRNPGQVLRLVSALREGPGSEVVVSHSQDQSRLEAHEVEARGGHLLPHRRGPVRWGSWAYLRSLLDGFAWMAERFDPDWTVVLSGQDYPLRPLSEIESFFASTDFDALLGAVHE
ncbi:MAG TPA: hypothetical protein VGV34_06975, partial [Solirubrobacterales bacterium]|nr:hypothetical protein [Solirubrobacterales bacterium]